MDFREITHRILGQIAPLAERLELLIKNALAKKMMILMGLAVAFATLVAFLINKVSF